MRERKKQESGRRFIRLICIIVFIASSAGLAGYGVFSLCQDRAARKVQTALQDVRKTGETVVPEETEANTEAAVPETESKTLEILSKYRSLYEINHDMVGWLTIEGTVIDYPMMQTMEDESYYLSVDFYGQPNQNGCLVMDTDSVVGTGTKADGYMDGEAPSTNLIIHGHTMRSGDMFGDLDLYADEAYGKEHSRISFVFKYYKFFQADTQEEFDDWYGHIKELSLYDTGVTAELVDEFITLSCCAYHVEDGRFVVVAKRTK